MSELIENWKKKENEHILKASGSALLITIPVVILLLMYGITILGIFVAFTMVTTFGIFMYFGEKLGYLEQLLKETAIRSIRDLTRDNLVDFMKLNNIMNKMPEIPYRKIRSHFLTYPEKELIDILTELRSEGRIYEPEPNKFKLIEQPITR